MPSIAIVCRVADGYGGTTRTILEHARRLHEKGWRVDVVADYFDEAAVKATGATPVRLRSIPWGSWVKRLVFAARADRIAPGYDLVHGHGDHFEQDILSLHNCVHAAHEAVHGKAIPADSAVARLHAKMLAGRNFKVLIANSNLMAEDVASRFALSRASIQVVYPGYDSKKFRAKDREKLRPGIRKELGLNETSLLFGLITSGDFLKRGVERFITAFGLLSKKVPDARALVVGKENKLGDYRAMAAAVGVEKSLFFLPPRKDVESLYHALDVYVHPAAYEEFGQSVQEALACGLPVIAGRKVGAAELMPHEAKRLQLGTLAPEELAEKMERLASEADTRRKLGALGPGAVAANDWDANFAATLAIYERLLSEKARQKK